MKILMFTIGYPPTQIGGTEVYVAGLVEGLRRRQHDCEVIYLEQTQQGDDIRVVSENRNRVPVHIVVVPRSRFKLEFLAFDVDLRVRLVEEFQKVVRTVCPDIVHVHPLQLGLESHVMEALRSEGRTVVLTYHSTTTTCARGDLVLYDREVCDGLVMQGRCTACLMHSRGVPESAAKLLSKIPTSIFRAAHARITSPALRRLRSLLSLPLIIEERGKNWKRATDASNRIVAVGGWVKQVCLANGVSEDKLTFSRHGRELPGEALSFAAPELPTFGFVGRLSPEKGVDVLIDAILKANPRSAFRVEFVSTTFTATGRRAEEDLIVRRLEAAALNSGRIVIRGSVSDKALCALLRSWDALIVPSIWLESGPQVIYEAYSVQTPIIGSRRGGIAELVTHGQTGFLFSPGNVAELAGLLERFSDDPAPLRQMRAHIPAVRSTDDVVSDMLQLYAGLRPELALN